jgi:hypothetical protein
MKLNFFELAMPDYGYNFGKAWKDLVALQV